MSNFSATESKGRRIAWVVIAIICFAVAYELLEPSMETLKFIGGSGFFIIAMVYLRSAIRGYA